MEQLKTLLQQVYTVALVEKKKQEEKFKRGESFNVFNILGIESNEVRLHSAFLAELLNPKGCHGMGDTFLKLFLEQIGIPSDFINPDNINASDTIVERSIGDKTDSTGGRLDIIIDDYKHAVIIENKIYAGDQENQLLRYNNYGKDHFGTGNFVLIYLTLDGHEASEGSADGSFEYICLSYKDDIINWLDKCAKYAYTKPLVRETLNQYVDLLKQLTGKTMDNEGMEKVADIVVSNDDNVEALIAITEAQDEIAAALREKYLFSELREFSKVHDLIFERSNKISTFSFKKNGWKGIIRIQSDTGKWNGMYLGITFEPVIPIQPKLDYLEKKPNDYWPYGYSMLGYDLNSTRSYSAMRDGAIVKWIEDKVLKMLEDIDSGVIKIDGQL